MQSNMGGSGLSYGLNIIKKQSLGSRPAPDRRKPIFDEDDASDAEEHHPAEVRIEEIDGVGEYSKPKSYVLGQDRSMRHESLSKPKSGALGAENRPESLYGDLSTSFTSRKHANIAEELDPNIYDYDGVYDSMRPQKMTTVDDIERKPKYMTNLLAAAAVRKRDAAIAEEKKLAREREAEGEEFADKEKFVTSAYKKQQEENRRIEEEERIREEQEQKQNKGTGMTRYFKDVLEKGEQRHAKIVEAVKLRSKAGPASDEIEANKEKSEAEIAREINEKRAGAVVVNEEGQVVDRRQLLKGGLNILPRQKSTLPSSSAIGTSHAAERSRRSGIVGAGGGKQAMRERQSQMLEAQLEAVTKRAHEEEEEERLKVERAAKSRKTDSEIMSAKERYLARKREAEGTKRNGQ